MKNTTRIIFTVRMVTIVLGGLLLSGCSTIVNAHRQKAQMMYAYRGGDLPRAGNLVSRKLRPPAWWNSSVTGTGDEIPWLLEAGVLNFLQGKYPQSADSFSRVEALAEEYRERAAVSLRDAGAELAALLTNPNAVPYRSLCRDRVALSIYKSLAYLGMGREDAFRAQIKRLRNEQKLIQEEHENFIEKENSRIELAKSENPEAAARLGNLEGNVLSGTYGSEAADAWEETMRFARQGYGNFMNPVAVFLSGLVSMREKNYDNARIDFRNLLSILPGHPFVRLYLAQALQRAGRELPEDFTEEDISPFPLDRNCVWVLFANGTTAALRQVEIPSFTAWPMPEYYPAPYDYLTARADGADYYTHPLADMDAVLAQEYKVLLPTTITRIVLSTLVKEAAFLGTNAAIYNSKMNPGEKGIAMAAWIIAGTAYKAAFNTADTRTWETLPKEFQLTQFPMPRDKKVNIFLQDRQFSLDIPTGAESAFIFVNAPTPLNVTAQVLPLFSK